MTIDPQRKDSTMQKCCRTCEFFSQNEDRDGGMCIDPIFDIPGADIVDDPDSVVCENWSEKDDFIIGGQK